MPRAARPSAKKTEPQKRGSKNQATTPAQKNDRVRNKEKTRVSASMSRSRLERGSDQAAPPCARVDGLEPSYRTFSRGRSAGHLSGSDRATRCPTGKGARRGATLVGQGCVALSTNS